jgi:opacity protein-like surface antigen
MKKFTYIVSFLLILLFFSVSFVQAQDKTADTKGIYVGLIGGYVIPSSYGGAILDASTGANLYTNYDPVLKNGYLYGAKVGWLTPFTKRILALELEYNHITNDFDKAKNADTVRGDYDLNSTINIDLIMINLIARYPNGRFHPYVGAGAGYAYANINDIVESYPAYETRQMSGGSKSVFAYQGMTGIDVDITKNIIVGLAYKYIALQKISYNSNLYSSVDGYSATIAETNYRSHNITLSLSYMF